MVDIASVVAAIERTPDCKLYPSAGIPSVGKPHGLPEDVAAFYELCGGAILFERSPYSVRIVAPASFVLANPVILVGLTENQLDSTRQEISWSWYLIAEGDSGQYFSIDLAPERLGRCYYTFWDSHAMRGHSPIVAKSYSNFLERMLSNRGQEWYWERPGEASLGDAYD